MRIIHLTAIVLLLAAYALVKIPGAVLLLKPYGIDLYRLGDLYRYSYLSEYRDTTQTFHHPPSSITQVFQLTVMQTGIKLLSSNLRYMPILLNRIFY
jgi:hypothetical protein